VCLKLMPCRSKPLSTDSKLELASSLLFLLCNVQLCCVCRAGVVLVPAGSADTVVTCNPYASACWGAAPIW
jgi:hypothetical protein